jgi:hypothetical protein
MAPPLKPAKLRLRDDPVYSQLRDHKIKDLYLRARYQRVQRTRNGRVGIDPSEITLEELWFIIEAAMDYDTINSVEHEDLKLLLSKALLTPHAKKWLSDGLAARAKRHITARLNKLDNEGERKRLFDALSDDVINGLNYRNPVSNVQYTSAEFETVRRLIARNHITVYEYQVLAGANAEAVGKTSAGGFYDWKANKLKIRVPGDPYWSEHQGARADYRDTVVHESTHALQDWKNRKMNYAAVEADAYVAGALTYYLHPDSKGFTPLRSLTRIAYDGPARLIVDKKTGEKEYAEEYQRLMKAVSEADNYKDWADKDVCYCSKKYENVSPDREKEIASQIYREILRARKRR